MFEKTDNEILQLFRESDALLRGHFLLTSGKHSEWYFEKIRLIEKPAVLDKIVDRLAEKIRKDGGNFEVVVSPAYGAIAIGFLAALKLGRRFAFTQRAEGTMDFRSGFAGIDGARVVVVEDIMTTGGSIREVVAALEKRQAAVEGIYVLVDRTGGEASVDGRPVRGLLSLKVEAFEAAECPLCRSGVSLVKPGASDKKT
jgi:orotate phosphoribosyltransferase